MADTKEREFVLAGINIVEQRINGRRVKVIVHEPTRIQVIVPFDASDAEIEQATSRVVDNVLFWNDIIEDGLTGDMIFQRKEE